VILPGKLEVVTAFPRRNANQSHSIVAFHTVPPNRSRIFLRKRIGHPNSTRRGSKTDQCNFSPISRARFSATAAITKEFPFWASQCVDPREAPLPSALVVRFAPPAPPPARASLIRRAVGAVASYLGPPALSSSSCTCTAPRAASLLLIADDFDCVLKHKFLAGKLARRVMVREISHSLPNYPKVGFSCAQQEALFSTTLHEDPLVDSRISKAPPSRARAVGSVDVSPESQCR
jgi:hypothetical protein